MKTRTIVSTLGAVAVFAVAPAASSPAQAAQALEIDAGQFHTCALTTAGGIKCWGYNDGRLGDGTMKIRRTPVDVTGLGISVVQVAPGSWHTCALTTAGGVKCWGTNSYGQLGDGTWDDQTSPIDVPDLTSGVTLLASGWHHTCAITTAGGALCWGSNEYGELGSDSDGQRPEFVTGLQTGVAQIAAGGYHTCALTIAGGVKCWGDNTYGQLGDNSTESRYEPVDVAGLGSGVTQITAGESHTCALTDAGGALCWGGNDYGQLGNNSTRERHTPVSVIGLGSGVTRITAGREFTCALIDAGAAKCWGANYYGQVGDTTSDDRLRPTDVTGLGSGVTGLSAGGYHACALIPAGIKCWGNNEDGELGDNTAANRFSPVFVQGFGGIATKTKLRTSRPKARTGQAIVFTATIGPLPTGGKVTFTDKGNAIVGCWRIPVVNGRARCTVRYRKPGTHRIVAHYLGSDVHKASASAALVQVVKRAG